MPSTATKNGDQSISDFVRLFKSIGTKQNEALELEFLCEDWDTFISEPFGDLKDMLKSTNKFSLPTLRRVEIVYKKASAQNWTINDFENYTLASYKQDLKDYKNVHNEFVGYVVNNKDTFIIEQPKKDEKKLIVKAFSFNAHKKKSRDLPKCEPINNEPSMYDVKDNMGGFLTLLEWINKNKDIEPSMYEFKDRMGGVLTLLELIDKNKDSEPSMYEFKDKMGVVLTLLDLINKNKDSEPSMYEFKDKMSSVITLLDLINKNKDSEPSMYEFKDKMGVVLTLLDLINKNKDIESSMYEFKDKMGVVLTLLEWNNKNKDSEHSMYELKDKIGVVTLLGWIGECRIDSLCKPEPKKKEPGNGEIFSTDIVPQDSTKQVWAELEKRKQKGQVSEAACCTVQ